MQVLKLQQEVTHTCTYTRTHTHIGCTHAIAEAATTGHTRTHTHARTHAHAQVARMQVLKLQQEVAELRGSCQQIQEDDSAQVRVRVCVCV